MGGPPSGGPNYLFEKSKLDLILKQGPPIFSENGGEDFKKCFIKTGLFNNLLNNLFKKTLKIQGIKIKYALNSYYDSFSYGENVLFFFKKLSYFYKYKKNFLNVLNMSNLTIKKKKLFNTEQNYNFRNDIKGGQFNSNKDSRFLFYGFYIFQKIKANSFIKKQIYSIHPLNSLWGPPSLKEGGPKIEKWGPPNLKRGGGKKMVGVKGFITGHGQSPWTKQPGPPSLIWFPYNPKGVAATPLGLYGNHIRLGVQRVCCLMCGHPYNGLCPYNGCAPAAYNPQGVHSRVLVAGVVLGGNNAGVNKNIFSLFNFFLCGPPPEGAVLSDNYIPKRMLGLIKRSPYTYGLVPPWGGGSPPQGGAINQQTQINRFGAPPSNPFVPHTGAPPRGGINPPGVYGRAISHTAIKNMGVAPVGLIWGHPVLYAPPYSKEYGVAPWLDGLCPYHIRLGGSLIGRAHKTIWGASGPKPTRGHPHLKGFMGRAHKSIQPYKTGGQTVILPAKENLKNHMNQIKDIFFKVQGESQESLIKKTSSIIHKWSDYYKIIPRNSNKLQFLLVKILWKWCSKRHNHVSNFWIKEKYFFSLNNKKYLFCFLLSVPPLGGSQATRGGYAPPPGGGHIKT
jgi:hypothetical protein